MRTPSPARLASRLTESTTSAVSATTASGEASLRSFKYDIVKPVTREAFV